MRLTEIVKATVPCHTPELMRIILNTFDQTEERPFAANLF